MIYCKYCGQKIDDGSVFCANCGKKLIGAEHDFPIEISKKVPENVAQTPITPREYEKSCDTSSAEPVRPLATPESENKSESAAETGNFSLPHSDPPPVNEQKSLPAIPLISVIVILVVMFVVGSNTTNSSGQSTTAAVSGYAGLNESQQVAVDLALQNYSSWSSYSVNGGSGACYSVSLVENDDGTYTLYVRYVDGSFFALVAYVDNPSKSQFYRDDSNGISNWNMMVGGNPYKKNWNSAWSTEEKQDCLAESLES